MMVGLVLAGLILGATAASAWVVTGGSILLAVALYSLVASLFILATTGSLYLASKRRESGEIAIAKGLRPIM